MASRFVVRIEELRTPSENLNTRKSTNLLVGVFKKWGSIIKKHLRRSTWRHTRFKNLSTSSQLINLRINFAQSMINK
jgi:hypothetical protein